MGAMTITCSHSFAKVGTLLFYAYILFLIPLSIREAKGLTLTAGQRILPRDVVDTRTKSLFNLPLVEQWATQQDLQACHIKSIYRVLFRKDGVTLESLVNEDLSPRHAAALLENFSPATCTLTHVYPSTSGGKRLIVQLESGKSVETVLIRHERRGTRNTRFTVCVSSQVGCAKACSFCATGTMGLQAQLSSAEILEQVFIAQNVVREMANEQQGSSLRIRNVVFMGMGEPLDNYSAVHEACRGLTHQCLFGMKAKHVTISTVGASPHLIRQLTKEAPQISLALSLHGATQQLRERLIPAAERAPLADLEAALDHHSRQTGRGVMVEYLLIDGVNDDQIAAKALVEFCLSRNVFVNLIPYNPTLAGGRFGYQTPSDKRIRAFHEHLRRSGVKSLLRWSSASGRDANGACGQLVLSEM